MYYIEQEVNGWNMQKLTQFLQGRHKQNATV